MDLHKLRIFVAIARTGSFTRAAEQLYTTQPTISQQLAQLEAELGVSLIERRPRRQRLTPAGEALLPRAEQLLSLAESATEATRKAAGLAERTVRLGVGFVLAAYLLPGVLRRYSEFHLFEHVRADQDLSLPALVVDILKLYRHVWLVAQEFL